MNDDNPAPTGRRSSFWSLPARAMRDAFASGYSTARLRADASAGVVVGLVALPLSMALAIASGVPPQYGLYTAIVGGAVIALSGGSRTQVSGPTAAFVVVLAPVVLEHGLGGLCVATALAGAILVLMALLRLGGMVNLVPYPVISGFTLGIACVIAIGQLPDLLGISAVGLDPHPLPRLFGSIDRLGEFVLADLLLGVSTLILLAVWPRVSARLPAPLVALLAVSLLGAGLRTLWPDIGFSTLGDRFSFVDASGETAPGIPPWPPRFALPWQLGGADGAPLVPDLALVRALFPSAFAIAMLGAIESLLSATVADGMTGSRHDPDAELLGQGLGNIVAPFFGGFAATGAIARTATNVRAGATSPIASVVHAAFLVLSMLLLAPLLGRLPMAALAALLIRVAWNMSEVRHVYHVVRTAPGHDVGVLALCFALTVVFDMVIAVVVGVVLASLLFMRRMAEISGAQILPAGHEELDSEVPDGVLVYEVAGPLFFGAAHKAMATVGHTGSSARVVVILLRAVPAIDATGLVNLRSALGRLHASGTVVILAGLRDQPLRALRKARVEEQQGALEFHRSLRRAIDRARELALPVAEPIDRS